MPPDHRPALVEHRKGWLAAEGAYHALLVKPLDKLQRQAAPTRQLDRLSLGERLNALAPVLDWPEVWGVALDARFATVARDRITGRKTEPLFQVGHAVASPATRMTLPEPATGLRREY